MEEYNKEELIQDLEIVDNITKRTQSNPNELVERIHDSKLKDLIKKWLDSGKDDWVWGVNVEPYISSISNQLTNLDFETILESDEIDFETKKNIVLEHKEIYNKPENIFNNDKIATNIKIMIWENMEDSMQEQHADLFSKITEEVSNSRVIINLWKHTSHKVQEQNAQLFVKMIKKDETYLGGDEAYLDEDLISKTSKKVLKLAIQEIANDKTIENVCEVLKENPQVSDELIELKEKQEESIQIFTETLDSENSVASSKLVGIINQVKTNNYITITALGQIAGPDIKNGKLEEILFAARENPDYLKTIWEYADMDPETIKEKSSTIFKGLTGKEEVPEKFPEVFDFLTEKNDTVLKTLNWSFLDMAMEQGYTNEQILRITNYPEMQTYLLKTKDSAIMDIALKYVLENDTNWILSIENKIRPNGDKYTDLLENLSLDMGKEEIDEQFIQNFLAVVSDTDNYFNIKTAEDVRNYTTIKNETCKRLLDGNHEWVPEKLREYSEEDLYKFALLEYKLGISLEEAKFILERYGQDAEEIFEKNPESREARYLMALKTILECEDIEAVVEDLKENESLGKEWEGYPSARNAEGQIINMFAELYNEKLYQPKEEDKLEQQETYTDKDGKEHDIDMYYINGDFDANIRVEGAYRDFSEPENFEEYYNQPSMGNHGNCESYIGSDLIAGARDRGGVAVGYSFIKPNNLTASAPYDLGSKNDKLSNYRERSEFRTPKQMKDNTRHTHNEMVKDRITVDENGEVQKYKPDYAIWIEESTEEERKMPGWQEKRDKDPQWIMTKKLAAQLRIPIVIIDREHFAKRETEKIDVLEKLITGEEIDLEKHGEYVDQYKNLSKVELIRELITKYENNRVGLQFNDKLSSMYFTQDQLESIVNNILSTLSPEEKKQLLPELAKIAQKETIEMEIQDEKEEIKDGVKVIVNKRIIDEQTRAKAFYADLETKCKAEMENSRSSNNQAQEEVTTEEDKTNILFQLFKDKEISREDVQNEQARLVRDVKEGQKEQSVEEQK